MITRRLLIGGAAGIAGAGALGWTYRNEILRWRIASARNEEAVISDALLADANACVLTPAQDEGPYFVRAPVRSDIREDRQGIPLKLALRIVRADGCTAVPDALVEIWHCDNAGRYSAYPEDMSRSPFDTFRLVGSRAVDGHVPPFNDKTYLRGAQATDEKGYVAFQTIFPGWYDPRIPHIHVKVFRDDESLLTTQLYFPDAITSEIYKTHADYAPHGPCPYTTINDTVIGMYPDASGLVLQPAQAAGGMTASALLGIA